MKDAAEFDILLDVDEEEPVVADAEAEFVPPLQGFYVALTGADEAVKRCENAHGHLAVDASNIGPGRFSPDDPLHCGSAYWGAL